MAIRITPIPDNEGSKPVDLSGTNIFTYQGQPVRQDDWEIIQAILERHNNSSKNVIVMNDHIEDLLNQVIDYAWDHNIGCSTIPLHEDQRPFG